MQPRHEAKRRENKRINKDIAAGAIFARTLGSMGMPARP